MPPRERPATVAVFCKPQASAGAVLQQIAAALSRHQVDVRWDEDAARELGVRGGLDHAAAAEGADLAISVGGDGTLLATARAIGSRETPILGVNLGSLGFLTQTRREELAAALDAVMSGQATVDRRSVLEVKRDGAHPVEQSIALNDVVFSKSDAARLFSLSLLVDGEWVADYRADGLIVATPTGSTAYNLAAGGPLIVPEVEALLATPICPHSLSQRPLILPATAHLTVRLSEGQTSFNVHVTLDGQVSFPLAPGESVHVSRGRHGVLLIRPPGKTFFATLRDKLGWGHP